MALRHRARTFLFLLSCSFAAAFLVPVRAQFPMGGVQEPRAVVKQFDRDANGRLNAEERQCGSRVPRDATGSRIRSRRSRRNARTRRAQPQVRRIDGADVSADRAVLRSGHTSHALSRFRKRRLERRARRLQRHGRRGAGDASSRWTDLPRRGHPNARRVVLHDGAEGSQTLVERHDRFRSRQPEHSGLSDAEPAERQR